MVKISKGHRIYHYIFTAPHQFFPVYGFAPLAKPAVGQLHRHFVVLDLHQLLFEVDEESEEDLVNPLDPLPEKLINDKMHPLQRNKGAQHRQVPPSSEDFQFDSALILEIKYILRFE